jgi:hypothetical protein
MSEEYVIACMRAHAAGPATKSKIGYCGECQYPIYISKSTPTIDGATYICLQCVDLTAIKSVIPPTRNQINDILTMIGINRK